MYARSYSKQVTEVDMTNEELSTFEKALDLAWEIGQSDDFESMPENIQTLVDDIADKIEELLQYVRYDEE